MLRNWIHKFDQGALKTIDEIMRLGLVLEECQLRCLTANSQNKRFVLSCKSLMCQAMAFVLKKPDTWYRRDAKFYNRCAEQSVVIVRKESRHRSRVTRLAPDLRH